MKLPFGSRENRGSRPSVLRTWSAIDRYSRFTDAAWSHVGTTDTAFESSAQATPHRPPGRAPQPSFRAGPALLGTRSALQPRSYSMRRIVFSSESLSRRSSSSFLDCCSSTWALHSPCMGLSSLSPSEYQMSPMGRPQWEHRPRTRASRSSSAGGSVRRAPTNITSGSSLASRWPAGAVSSALARGVRMTLALAGMTNSRGPA
mmetsp:Transcript_69959/g.197406  ORF Transcript_69959/g.197406 Transcript_69959/m.197406 type:complete len:203 (+) Transcript_69959:450-1058(+)